MSLSLENVVEEMIAALARVRAGDFGVSVSFAESDGAVGRLGKEFNETVRRLGQARGDNKRIGRLVHDIKNPLAGIAGVIDVIGSELPPESVAREVLPAVKQEIEKIKRLLADFASQ